MYIYIYLSYIYINGTSCQSNQGYLGYTFLCVSLCVEDTNLSCASRLSVSLCVERHCVSLGVSGCLAALCDSVSLRLEALCVSVCVEDTQIYRVPLDTKRHTKMYMHLACIFCAFLSCLSHPMRRIECRQRCTEVRIQCMSTFVLCASVSVDAPSGYLFL